MGPELAIAALAVGTATQVAGGLMKGKEEERAAGFERWQYGIQQKQLEAAASRDEAQRRRELRSSVDTILAIRAGRGVGQGTPTENAILDDITQRAHEDILAQRTSLLTRSAVSGQAAAMAERRGRMAVTASYINAIGDIAGMGYKVGTLKTRTGVG
jgi:hypothetical protein